jgi:N-methylhydantoinase B
VLYLYRREVPDSGGAGRYRGGNSAAFAVVPHGVEQLLHAPSAAGCAVPTSSGLAGGYPARTNAFRMRRGTDLRARFARGELPTSLDVLDGEDLDVGPKARGLTQGPDDVWEVAWCAGGGYGDPLSRDAERVLEDVNEGRVSAAWARAGYGVVLSGGSSPHVLDVEATARERAARRASFIQPDAARGAATGRPISEALLRFTADGVDEFRCAACGARLGDARGNYKHAARCEETGIEAANPLIRDPAVAVDAALVLRRWHCPGCGVTLDTEVAQAGDAPLWDIELA